MNAKSTNTPTSTAENLTTLSSAMITAAHPAMTRLTVDRRRPEGQRCTDEPFCTAAV